MYERVSRFMYTIFTRANLPVITMITGRLNMVRKKQQMIAEANNKTQHMSAMRRLSADVTPRSLPSYGS